MPRRASCRIVAAYRTFPGSSDYRARSTARSGEPRPSLAPLAQLQRNPRLDRDEIQANRHRNNIRFHVFLRCNIRLLQMDGNYEFIIDTQKLSTLTFPDSHAKSRMMRLGTPTVISTGVRPQAERNGEIRLRAETVLRLQPDVSTLLRSARHDSTSCVHAIC